MERAIIKALERQYNDILTPLKDSIPKRLNMQVQKLTRRQSVTIYSVPSQVSDPHVCYTRICYFATDGHKNTCIYMNISELQLLL